MNVIISNKNDDALSSIQIDVIKKIHGEYSVEEIISMFENFFYEHIIIDITAIKGHEDVAVLQNLPMNLEPDKLILFLKDENNIFSEEYISKLISIGIYNFTKDKDGLLKLIEKSNTYKEVANMHHIEEKKDAPIVMSNTGTKVIGLKNLTIDSGSTTLIYMMKKELRKNYIVRCLEIDKKDFRYFEDNEMKSISSVNFGEELVKLKGNVDAVLVDLNDSTLEKLCNDIIYLIEPSIIKVNKLVSKDRELLRKVANRKVILNKCLLKDRDISKFEMESGVKIFASIPPLNDRIDNPDLNDFLVKLGFHKQEEIKNESNKKTGTKKSKLFGLFKRKS